MSFSEIQLIPGPTLLCPTVQMTAGQKLEALVTIVDQRNCPVDLTIFIAPYENPPSGDCSARRLPITTGILFTLRSYRGQDTPNLQITVPIEGDPKNGVVKVEILPCQLSGPGLYLGELSLIHESALKFSYPFYLEAAPSLAWKETAQPLTIAEIRLWSRDNSPEDNFLLNEVEFKDSEIIAAIRRGIDLWNSVAPILYRYTYTPSNFPAVFRSQWIDVTLAFLLEIAYMNYSRNTMDYSAAGLSISDKRVPLETYRKEADRRLGIFTSWVKETKVQLNLQQAWGRVGYPQLW